MLDQKRKICSLIAMALLLLFCGPARIHGVDLMWSTFLGKGGADESFGMFVADSGDVYLTGFTGSADFPATKGAFDTTYNGGVLDAFVVRLDPNGRELDYVTFLGGNGTDQGYGIAVDVLGNAYVTGRTSSADFPTTRGAFDTTPSSNYDLFVTKLGPTGDVLVYSTLLGGRDYDGGKGIVVDDVGNAYLTGWTKSDDFPTTAGAFSTVYLDSGAEDAFVAKLNPTGSDLVYATFLGGSRADLGYDIALDGSGNAYIAMLTYSDDIPTTAGAFDATYGGNKDGFVAKLSPEGDALVYAAFLGGSSPDWCQSITADEVGNAYLTGMTSSVDFPVTTGALDAGYNGLNDVFVAKLNPSGGELLYSTFLGGRDEEQGSGIALDRSGNILVSGWTKSDDFPTTTGAFDTSYNGQADVFVVKLDSAGGILAYATLLGGDSTDVCQCFALDVSGNACLSGWTESEDFPVTAGAFDTIYNGREDIFVAKVGLAGRPIHGHSGKLRDR